jgi:hypothetical protein
MRWCGPGGAKHSAQHVTGACWLLRHGGATTAPAAGGRGRNGGGCALAPSLCAAATVPLLLEGHGLLPHTSCTPQHPSLLS